jgi:hypothetical protein
LYTVEAPAQVSGVVSEDEARMMPDDVFNSSLRSSE